MICSNALVVRGGLSDALPERYVAFRVIHIGSNLLCSDDYRVLECLILVVNDICLIAAINLGHSVTRTIALLRSCALRTHRHV